VRSSTEAGEEAVELGVTGVMVGVHVSAVVGAPVVNVIDGVAVMEGVTVAVPGMGVNVIVEVAVGVLVTSEASVMVI